MIYGIGADIVEVRRISELLARHGERFARRILSAEEWGEYRENHQPARFLANRFAAKEAFAKALGTGLRHPASLRSIAVAHDALGKPVFRFAPQLADFLAKARIVRHHLTISDENSLACAFVVLEEHSGS